tara:strand:- start:318 stop:512 length:195 start_codon:yes stop_codon:yes gene_type:complete
VEPNKSPAIGDISDKEYSVIKQTSASFVVKISTVSVAGGVPLLANALEKSLVSPDHPVLVGVTT